MFRVQIVDTPNRGHFCPRLDSRDCIEYCSGTNSTGTTNNNAIVPNRRPPTVSTPTDIFPLAPTPEANIRGSIPNTIVAEIMIIGRKRAFATDLPDNKFIRIHRSFIVPLNASQSQT